MTPPTMDRVRALLDEARGRRMLVLGDLILDSYLWGRVDRISPEAPVPVVRLERESHRLGGAANVARNLAALGARVEMAGVVGEDEGGETLRELLGKEGIGVRAVLQEEGRPTIRKTRVIAHHQQVVRVDRDHEAPPATHIREELCAFLRATVPACEAVVVEDYEKGVVDDMLMEVVREMSESSGVPFFVDPKGRDPSLFRGARCLTPNRAEAAYMTGCRMETDSDLEEAAQSILDTTQAEGVLLTRGEQGMILFDSSGGAHPVPALVREVYDVTGAGDTVIAALALLAGREGELLEAAYVASCAAAVTVQHLGTVAPSPKEIQEAAAAMQGS